MSAAYLLLADVHAHTYPGPVNDQGQNLRLLDVMSVMYYAIECAKKSKARHIIIAGDLFHDRRGVRPEVLHQIGSWIARCSDEGLQVTILTGNHDLSVGGDGSSSVAAFMKSANIILRPEVRYLDEHPFCFLPYTDDPERVRQIVQKFVREVRGKKTLIGHIGLGDPRYAQCVPVDYEVPGHIALSDLCPDEFHQIFLGHYHRHQQLRERSWYIGSPLQLSFKEAGEEKYVLTYRPEDEQSVQKWENDFSPRFYKKTAKEILDEDGCVGIRDRDFLHIITESRDDEEEVKRVLQDRQVSRVRLERKIETSKDVRLSFSGNVVQNLEQFVRYVQPDLPDETVRQYVRVGVELLQSTTQGDA